MAGGNSIISSAAFTEHVLLCFEHAIVFNFLQQILVNSWAIARDPKYWENPTVFTPERFLSSEIDYKGQHFEFLPFGSGRRMCPGIPVAQRVVSLMIAALVYHFDWKLPHPVEELDMNVTFGLTLQRAKPLVAIPVAREI